ncbi:MAG: 4-carboxy-4-hydroxy-2-oxoadipate aldolase/oxaloacetate decarboxylase [Clostridia bacterium]|jgi:4-hydroxy-4-methyl-2-oxoglutarate aldolase|nr:4-carboxy-4-hydroxy-2-oxoadipate aldolase/oxaloacetate decarboxylase [Clostridia bacterium]
MQRYIVKNIPRPNKEVSDKFAELGAATVYEAQGKTGLMNERLKPLDKNYSVCGPAVTVVCQPGDNLMIHAAVEVCRPGDIVVITTLGDNNYHGMIGDLLVSSFIKQGVKAIIIDNGVRDSKTLREFGLPIWSSSVICTGTSKNQSGWVNSPAVCGNTIVEPGDLIVADDDGIVVVKKSDIQSSMEKAVARAAKEEKTRAKIEAGELGVDFYGFRNVIKDMGIEYYENLEDIN